MASDAICSLDREAEDTGIENVLITITGLGRAAFFPVLDFLQGEGFGIGSYLLPDGERQAFATFTGRIKTGEKAAISVKLWRFLAGRPDDFGKGGYSFVGDFLIYPWGVRDTNATIGAGWVQFSAEIAERYGITITEEARGVAARTVLAV